MLSPLFEKKYFIASFQCEGFIFVEGVSSVVTSDFSHEFKKGVQLSVSPSTSESHEYATHFFHCFYMFLVPLCYLYVGVISCCTIFRKSLEVSDIGMGQCGLSRLDRRKCRAT